MILDISTYYLCRSRYVRMQTQEDHLSKLLTVLVNGCSNGVTNNPLWGSTRNFWRKYHCVNLLPVVGPCNVHSVPTYYIYNKIMYSVNTTYNNKLPTKSKTDLWTHRGSTAGNAVSAQAHRGETGYLVICCCWLNYLTINLPWIGWGPAST